MQSVLLPVDTAQTWQQHFESRGWSSPQAQIDAGFPIYAQPAAASGSYVEVFDFGSTFESSRVVLTYTGQVVAGSPTVIPRIEISADGSAWTAFDNVTEIFATQFRYVRITITVTGDGVALYRLTALNCRLDAKLKNDGGGADAVATDADGTLVPFNLPFVKVTSITVTPNSTERMTAVASFTDTLSPTGFRVRLFNDAGVRVTGPVFWSVKGY